MKAAEIREPFLSFFEERDHLRMPSASLVPVVLRPLGAAHDRRHAAVQALLPRRGGAALARGSPRCQKCFRTTDIEDVGTTARHLTFFEMLGNFSFGDYFKQGAVEYAWELSTQGFGARRPSGIWITVFGGDDELGLGPDEEAIECWRAVGVPDERIVQLGRDGQLLAGRARPGPAGRARSSTSTAASTSAATDDRPGDDTERFLEFWNLVFMQYELHEDGSLDAAAAEEHRHRPRGSSAWRRSSRTSPSVFETDHFRPLVELGEELSGRSLRRGRRRPRGRCGCSPTTAAAMTFLIADGVVPSNEDRGYILRRIMRRAIQPGPRARHRGALPAAALRARGRGHGRRLSRARARARRRSSGGPRLGGGELRPHARAGRAAARRAGRSAPRRTSTSWIDAEDAFRLHDTYGFPYELTKELLAEEGLSVDDAGLRGADGAGARGARAAARRAAHGGERRRTSGSCAFARDAGFRTRFVGYETTEADTASARRRARNGRLLAKLAESPFYPEGGGQVSDSGAGRDAVGRARVVDVYRLGDDQALALEPVEGELGAGRAGAARGRRARAPRDDAQPHRHAPAARGAARAARHARAPGRLLRRPGQAALRLHPRRARCRDEELRGGRGARERLDRRQPPGARDRDHRDEAERARRDGAVRREVRRLGADGRGRGRSRASCAAARTWPRPPRSGCST